MSISISLPALLYSSLDVDEAAHGGFPLELLFLTHCVTHTVPCVCLTGGRCVLRVNLQSCWCCSMFIAAALVLSVLKKDKNKIYPSCVFCTFPLQRNKREKRFKNIIIILKWRINQGRIMVKAVCVSGMRCATFPGLDLRRDMWVERKKKKNSPDHWLVKLTWLLETSFSIISEFIQSQISSCSWHRPITDHYRVYIFIAEFTIKDRSLLALGSLWSDTH